jgi:hypothetical protein
MAACKWIDVQFSGREEFRPTLVEHRTAYSVFDCQAFQPRVVLSIGGIEKRRFYRRINLNDAVDGNPGVLLRPVQLATLILDCELHNHNRLDVVQQYLSRGEEVMHSLQANLYRHGPSHKIAQYAFDMYWQLLYPFASTVLLFIDDLGGVGPVIEILALWARRARLSSIAAPPRILVLYHWRNRTEMDSFESRLRSRIMCTVSGTQPYSRTGITSPIYLQGEMAFESVQLIPTWKAASEFPSQTEESFAARDAAGYGFSSDHLKRLLQTAILQYSQSSGQQIDFVQAVRFCNPPPTQLTEKLIQFLSITKDAEMDHVAVIASALDLDAHPPGMHCELGVWPLLIPANVASFCTTDDLWENLPSCSFSSREPVKQRRIIRSSLQEVHPVLTRKARSLFSSCSSAPTQKIPSYLARLCRR